MCASKLANITSKLLFFFNCIMLKGVPIGFFFMPLLSFKEKSAVRNPQQTACMPAFCCGAKQILKV